MKVTKTGKRKLFRMTVKRKIIMSDIIVAVNIRLESVDKDGFGRMLVEHNDKLTEEERAERLKKLDSELQQWYLLHDVLEAVTCHEEDFLLNMHMKVKRGWRNEWDVPLEVFNDSIDKVIDLLRWYQEKGRPEQSKDYDDKVDFLLLIKEFRNQEGS